LGEELGELALPVDPFEVGSGDLGDPPYAGVASDVDLKSRLHRDDREELGRIQLEALHGFEEGPIDELMVGLAQAGFGNTAFGGARGPAVLPAGQDLGAVAIADSVAEARAGPVHGRENALGGEVRPLYGFGQGVEAGRNN